MSNFEIQSCCIAAISGICVMFSMIMYVDDTDLLLLGEQTDTYADILQKAQTLSNKWSRVLWSLGSALRPEKCFWFPITFSWSEDGNFHYCEIDDDQPHLEIMDHTRTPINIRRFHPDCDKEEILGINLAPDGNNKEQLKNIKKRD